MPGGGGGFRGGGGGIPMGDMTGGYMNSPPAVPPVSIPPDGVVVGDCVPPSSAPPTSSSSTQHLTSASLASLARLSQLSGSEGPFVGGGPPGCQARMASAPELQSLFADEGLQGPPVSGMYSMPNSAPYSSLPPGHFNQQQAQVCRLCSVESLVQT